MARPWVLRGGNGRSKPWGGPVRKPRDECDGVREELGKLPPPSCEPGPGARCQCFGHGLKVEQSAQLAPRLVEEGSSYGFIELVAIPSSMSSSQGKEAFAALGCGWLTGPHHRERTMQAALPHHQLRVCPASSSSPQRKKRNRHTHQSDHRAFPSPRTPLPKPERSPPIPNPFVTPPEPCTDRFHGWSWDELGCEIAELPPLGIAPSSPD